MLIGQQPLDLAFEDRQTRRLQQRRQTGQRGLPLVATRATKTRLNFLDLLRAGHTDYVLNEAAFGLCAAADWLAR